MTDEHEDSISQNRQIIEKRVRGRKNSTNEERRDREKSDLAPEASPDDAGDKDSDGDLGHLNDCRTGAEKSQICGNRRFELVWQVLSPVGVSGQLRQPCR